MHCALVRAHQRPPGCFKVVGSDVSDWTACFEYYASMIFAGPEEFYVGVRTRWVHLGV